MTSKPNVTEAAPDRRGLPLSTCAALVVIGLLGGALLTPPRAVTAQVPDSGLQRQIMIEELRGINAKLTEAIAVLREIRDRPESPQSRPAPGSPGRDRHKP